jgi:hypothetical protein
MTDTRVRRVLASVFVLGVAAALSCASGVNEKRTTTILAPDQLTFETHVSPFLEKRCATLDCHGQIGRPLRIFSSKGLRIANDAGAFPGVGDTTPTEKAANYRTVIGLEPELMSRVVGGKANARDLLLIQKPLQLGSPESHKGGPVLAPQGDPGETCLTTWIYGNTDTAACAKAASVY